MQREKGPDIPSDLDNTEFKALIDNIMLRTGLSISEIARRSGLSPSTITRQIPVPVANHGVSYRTLQKIRQAFPEPEAHRGGAESQQPEKPGRAPQQSGRPAEFPLYNLTLFEEVAHAFGSAVSDLELLVGHLDRPIGRTQLSGSLQKDRFYLLFMPGDSMLPRFRPGETLLVDKVKPPSVGDDVLVQLAKASSTPLCCIAQLKDRSRSTLQLRQYGYAVDAEVEKSDVAFLHRIAGVFKDI